MQRSVWEENENMQEPQDHSNSDASSKVMKSRLEQERKIMKNRVIPFGLLSYNFSIRQSGGLHPEKVSVSSGMLHLSHYTLHFINWYILLPIVSRWKELGSLLAALKCIPSVLDGRRSIRKVMCRRLLGKALALLAVTIFTTGNYVISADTGAPGSTPTSALTP